MDLHPLVFDDILSKLGKRFHSINGADFVIDQVHNQTGAGT